MDEATALYAIDKLDYKTKERVNGMKVEILIFFSYRSRLILYNTMHTEGWDSSEEVGDG